jgi:hypothetical protein
LRWPQVSATLFRFLFACFISSIGAGPLAGFEDNPAAYSPKVLNAKADSSYNELYQFVERS